MKQNFLKPEIKHMPSIFLLFPNSQTGFQNVDSQKHAHIYMYVQKYKLIILFCLSKIFHSQLSNISWISNNETTLLCILNGKRHTRMVDTFQLIYVCISAMAFNINVTIGGNFDELSIFLFEENEKF